MPGYEDPFYHLWQERRLPVNVDPHQADLKDESERARLARILEQGLDRVVGHALPLQRSTSPTAPGWVSGPWFLRAERLYLAPGDSPMGLRLPLDSLPWVSEADYPYLKETDPTIPRPPLPERAELRQLCLQGAALKKPPAARGYDPPAQAGRVRGVDRTHGAVRGTAPGTAARFHAARRRPGGLPRNS